MSSKQLRITVIQLLLVNQLVAAQLPIQRYLDDGTGFKRGRDFGGLAYGWDCGGVTTNEDFIRSMTSGRRGLNRDAGLGMNHIDSGHTCVDDVNWSIEVPNGEYLVDINFGEFFDGADCAHTHGGEDAMSFLKVNGEIACYWKPACDYKETVLISDGKLTVSGHSHETGTCHSISHVKLTPAPRPPPGDFTVRGEFYFGTDMPDSPSIASADAILDDGTGFKGSRDHN